MPLEVAFSILIAAPMANVIAVVLLYGLLGWKVAAIYLLRALLIALSLPEMIILRQDS